MALCRGDVSQTAAAVVRCTPDLSKQQCSDCLNNATASLPQCFNGRQGGRVIAPSCNFRYEINQFYDDTAGAPTTTPSPPPTSQPPAWPDESPLPPPPTAAQPPISQSPPNQEGKASQNTSPTFVLVLVPLLLSLYLPSVSAYF